VQVAVRVFPKSDEESVIDSIPNNIVQVKDHYNLSFPVSRITKKCLP
jgi:hypothetical protein